MRLLTTLIVLCLPLSAMEGVHGWCEKGAAPVVAPSTSGGVPITRNFQQSFPTCTVTVYATGTGGQKANIYNANSLSAPLSNPFTATTQGYWSFFSPNGIVDVQISGGGLSAPFTFGAISLFDFLNQSALYLSQSFAGNVAGGYIHLPPITYPNSSCLDQYGNPVNIPVPSPGFPAFSANDTIMWVSPSPLNGVSPPACATALPANNVYGLNTNSYILAMGGLATSNGQFNSIHSLLGGVTAGSFTAGIFYPAGTVTTTGTLLIGAYLGGYAQVGHSNGAPASGTIATVTNPLTGGDGLNQGTVYWDDGLNCLRVYNGTTWACLSTSGGGGTASPPNTSIQFNCTGSFCGTSNLVWDNTNQFMTIKALNATSPGLAVTSGFIQSDTGFLAKNGLATNYNAIQAPTGGMYANSFTSQKYLQMGNSSGVPTPTFGDAFHAGALYFDTGSGTVQVFSGTAWVSLSTGATSPGGSNTNVQFNNSGAFGGSSNLTYASQLLTSIAVDSAHAGMVVTTGFMQADQGFLATSGTAVNYNVINAPTGGYGGRSATITKYVQIGNGTSAPTVTTGDTFHAGAMYYDTTSDCIKVMNNALAFNCVNTSGSGILSINGLTASAITLAGTTNEINLVSSGGNTITFSTPQAIATTSSPTFATVTATTGFASSNNASNVLNIPNGGSLQFNGTFGSIGNYLVVQGTNPHINAAGLGAALNINGSSSSNGAIILNPGNAGTANAIINDRNNSNVTTGNLVLNELTALGSNITMEHGGTFDAAWQAGSSAAFDVVDNFVTHRFIVLQGGAVLINRTSADGTVSRLQVNGTGSQRGINSVVAGAIAGSFSNNSASVATLNVNNSGSNAGILSNSGGFGIQDVSASGISISAGLSVGGHVTASGTTPAVSCTGGSVSISGDDFAGSITVNSTCTGFANVTVTFTSAFLSTPKCVGSIGTGASGVNLNVSASTTNIIFQNSNNTGFFSGAVIGYICVQ